MKYVSFFLIAFISCAALVFPYSPTISPLLMRKAYFEIGLFFITTLFFFTKWRKPEVCLIKSPLYFPMFLFLAWTGITYFWCINTYEWFNFIELSIECFLLYFLVANIINTDKRCICLLISILIAGVLISLFGISQYFFKIDWLPQISPPAATFGSRNRAAQFIIMVLPLNLLMIGRKLTVKILLICSSIVMLLYFFCIESRGSFIAFGAETVFIVIFMLCIKIKTYKRKWLPILIFILLITSIFLSISTLVIYDKNNRRSTKITKQIEFLISPKHNSRIHMWNNTCCMIKDNLLFGVGAGNWAVFYPLYVHGNSSWFLWDTFMHTHRNVHNDWLEILANLGIIGLGILIWGTTRLIKLWRFLIRSTKDKAEFYSLLGLGTAITGIMVNAFFSFPFMLVTIPILFVTYIGVLTSKRNTLRQGRNTSKEISSLKSPENTNNKSECKKNEPSKNRNSQSSGIFCIFYQKRKIGYLLLTFVFSGFTFLAIVKNKNWLLAQKHYNDALIYMRIKQIEKWRESARKTAFYNPYNPQYNAVLGSAYSVCKDYKRAVDYYKLFLKSNPYDYSVLFQLGLTYYYHKDYQLALETFEKIEDEMSLSGSMKKRTEIIARNYYRLAHKALRENNLEKALEFFQKRLKMHPDAAGNYDVGAVLLKLNRKLEALPYLHRAIKIKPDLKYAEEIKKLLKKENYPPKN